MPTMFRRPPNRLPNRPPNRLRVRLRDRLLARNRGPADRGDVPGWVLVTLMTAGLVLALWAVAGPRLTDVFNSAIDSVVSGP